MGQSFESEPHQNSLLCFQDGQLILLGLFQLPRLQIRHNCCFDLPQFPQFFSQVLIFSIFSFSSTLASPGTSMSIIILANYLLFVYYNKVSSIVFELMISLYAIKNHKGFDFLGLLNFSRDILLLLSLLILLLLLLLLLPLLSLLSLWSAFLSIDYSILNPTGI